MNPQVKQFYDIIALELMSYKKKLSTVQENNTNPITDIKLTANIELTNNVIDYVNESFARFKESHPDKEEKDSTPTKE